MRLIPHEHKFETKCDWLDHIDKNGIVVRRVKSRYYKCDRCRVRVHTQREADALTQDSIVSRASALCAWAMGLGVAIILVALTYRWSVL